MIKYSIFSVLETPNAKVRGGGGGAVCTLIKVLLEVLYSLGK